MKSHEHRLDAVVEAIATGYRAMESYQWSCGDAMVKNLGRVADPKAGHIRTEVEAILDRLSGYGIELAFETVRAWWYIASINPPAKRNSISFTAAQECGTDERRFDWYAQLGAGLSKREVRRLRGKKVDNPIRTSSPAEKLDTLIELMEELAEAGDDEALAELLEEHPKLQKFLDKLITKREKTARNSNTRRKSEWEDGDRLAEELTRFTESLTIRYESLAGTLTPDHAVQTRLLNEIGRLRRTLDLFESGLTEGLTFEQFVESLSA